MKSILSLASALALASTVIAAPAVILEREDEVNTITYATVINTIAMVEESVDTSTAADNATHIFEPIVNPALDRHAIVNAEPKYNVSLYYSSNTTSDSSMQVNHTMKYPTVVLEQIASVSNVDCSADSVVVTFSNASMFQTTQAYWASQGKFVMITNHLGDCDPELKRGFFLVDSISFNNTTLIATASSAGTNVSNTAAETTIAFGQINGASALTRRALVLNPTYNIDKSFSIDKNITLFSDSYATVETVDAATLSANVTFSGYLKYNWLAFKVKDLYFDIDADMSAYLALSADIKAQYSNTFSYTPDVLYYGFSIPGILEIGPALQFAIDAEIAADAETVVSTEVSTAIADGRVHVDLLNKANTKTSGWTPTYNAKINATGAVTAQINPATALTVEVKINFFAGLLDLSTGLTATAGMHNSLAFTGAGGIDLTGVEHLSANGTCAQGLALKSDFEFDLKAFATQFYKTDLYNVTLPLLNECYSWEK